MGLTDALLLDSALFEVWVAYRTDGIAAPIGTTQIESGGVRENLLRISNSHPLWHSKAKSGAIDYLENQGPGAGLAQGEQYDSAAQSFAMMDDLQTRIEDALLMSL